MCGGRRVLDECGVCVDAGTRRGLRRYQDCGNGDCLSNTGIVTRTHEVRIALSLPMSLAAFTDDKQTAFKSSLAQAAGVSNEDRGKGGRREIFGPAGGSVTLIG